MRQKRLALVAIILFGGALLRFWGLLFGLSPAGAGVQVYALVRPDEQYLWNIALRYFSGDLNPHFFLFPSLYSYFLAVMDGVYFALKGLFAGGWAEAIQAVLSDPKPLIIINRVVAAVLGSLTLVVVYRIAGKFFDRMTGVISALFLAAAFLHVRDSHFGVTDIPMTFLLCLSFLQAMKIYLKGRWSDYLSAGLLAGLAASTKYSGGIMVIPITVAHFLRMRSLSEKDDAAQQKFISAFLCMAAGFLIGTPFSFFARSEFRRDFALQFAAQDQWRGWRGVNLGRGWLYHFVFSLWYGLGWPLLIASVLGFVTGILKHRRQTLILLSLVFSYYLVAGKGYLVFVRYMTPMIPFLCISAAVFITWLSRRFLKGSAVAVVILCCLILLPSIKNVLAFNRLLTKTDSRVLAGQWIRENAGKHERLLIVGDIFSDPALVLKGRQTYYPYAWPPEFWADKADWPEGYAFDRVINENAAGLFSILRDRPPAFILVIQAPLRAYGPTGPLKDFFEGYDLVHEIEGIGHDARMRFDRHDAFYMPFHGAHFASRPGPNFFIYKRRIS